MKIALVHKRLDLNGGTERDLFQTAEGLRDRGHEVHLFCSEYGVEAPRGVVIHRVSVLPLGRTARLWSFAWFAPRMIERAGCEVVVSFGRLLRQDILRSGGGTHRGFLERLGQEGGARRRFWQRISIYHRSLLALERRQYHESGAAKIIAVSEEVKRDIVAHYSVPAERIVVIYNGVDQNRFHPARRAEVRCSMREHWKIPLDAPLVLFVGTGFRRKGLDRVISIWQSPKLQQVFLLVVGDDTRIGHYLSWANTIAPGRILFAGRRNDVENYYAAADVVVLPAVQEAFGNVVIEGLASGLAVLVSRSVGAAEILHGRLAQGIVNQIEDPKELEEKLLMLLERSRDPVWIGEARRVAEEYSWTNHFSRFEMVLREACRVPSGDAS
jgi:UDP-glucose:(heptosyl)LPS alpha-1,3-glucosyltransferase